MTGWGYTNIQGNAQISASPRHLELSPLSESNIMNPDESIYWIAPEPFLGNKVGKGTMVYIG